MGNTKQKLTKKQQEMLEEQKRIEGDIRRKLRNVSYWDGP